MLSPDSEDELLFQLCRWPNRLRHGATIDCTSVLHHVKNAIFEKVMREERPRLQLWFALVERLAQAAKLDPSLENDINQTIRRMLDAYPDAWPGNELLRIGLRTAEVTRDAELIALLLGREVERKLHQETKRKLRVKASDEEELSRLPTIPLVVFRRALEISLQNSDSQSAWAILEQYRYISGSYPSSANTELYGLVVLTNVSVQKYEQAKELLFLMITDKMEPTEELIGTVLHSLVAAGKVEDARKIFDSMTKGIEKLPAPNVTSFNAILAASINAREWDEVIELYGRMKEKGVHPNPQTIQALMLAHLNRDGKTGISSLMKKLLAERAPMDQNTFQLASRIVLPTINGENIDEIRNKARQVGEKEPRLRDASVKMIRSIRVAQVVQKKLQAKAVNTLGTKYPQPNEEWVNAFSDLLDFVQQMEMIGQH